jgi:hypothetical protein
MFVDLTTRYLPNPILPFNDSTKMTGLPLLKNKIKIDLALHILILDLSNLVLFPLFGTSRYFQLDTFFFSPSDLAQ